MKFTATIDGWSEVVKKAKQLGIYDSLIELANKITSQDPETYKADSWLSKSAPPEQMEMLKIQQAYSLSPEFRQLVISIIDNNKEKTEQLLTFLSEKIGK